MASCKYIVSGSADAFIASGCIGSVAKASLYAIDSYATYLAGDPIAFSLSLMSYSSSLTLVLSRVDLAPSFLQLPQAFLLKTALALALLLGLLLKSAAL